ncbi:16S rRNA (cytosine(1402)-N(4))-methyltransferase [Desulfobacterium sp. N47]|uniref:Ribosomal RNA small subunit methyltransferase H n=1 Tax=uncultured Desulfobacterium sp. TaxID=201089 RepID=E1YBU6_9BACT|nr:S-adenosyl-L-methionine-dependent methyltransferase mraW [uncultured Desulfobacterium sp.]
MHPYHIPVMTKEVIHYLDCKPGKIYADCTIGGSGHAKAICEKIMPNGILVGIDQDKDAIENAKKILFPHLPNIHLFHGNFVNLSEFLLKCNITKVDGIVLDLGLSLHQIDSSKRGFSFKNTEPLDMRMNTDSDINAGNLINKLDEVNLWKLIRDYGEEPWARNIARNIVKARKDCEIKTNAELVKIISDSIPKKIQYKQKIHPATRVFMALRIAVNNELERLSEFMDNVADLLNPEGRLCVLTFHSLEDRIVKQKIREMEKECVCPPNFPKCICNKIKLVRAVNKKAIAPGKEETDINPMARSAKLRVAERI